MSSFYTLRKTAAVIVDRLYLSKYKELDYFYLITEAKPKIQRMFIIWIWIAVVQTSKVIKIKIKVQERKILETWVEAWQLKTETTAVKMNRLNVD